MLELNTIHPIDCLDGLKKMPDQSVHSCITSPPYYGLRDYGVNGQIGLEESPEAYVSKLVHVFREVRRVLRNDGTLWLNLGDSYTGNHKGNKRVQSEWMENTFNGNTIKGGALRGVAIDGLKPKDLIGIPWRVALALQADGWYLRQDIIWHKPNPMPESVTDRCTKAHEYLFLLSKSRKYYFDHTAMQEKAVLNENRPNGVVRNRTLKYNSKPNQNPQAYMTHTTDESTKQGKEETSTTGTRNKRSVWSVHTRPFREAHFATFPEELIAPCVLAGAPESGIVLDPFMGAGTTASVALSHNRQFIGFELNPQYVEIANKRIDKYK